MDNLKEEFERWLSNETWNWTTYATLTFSRPMKKDALRFARAWVRFIARTAPRLWGFCFQETHSDGQRLHVHSLLSVTPNLIGEPSNKEMWSWWFQKFGRARVTSFHQPKAEISRIRTLSNTKEIKQDIISPLASYLTKYMVKETYSPRFDWDFYAFDNGKEIPPDEFERYSGLNPTFLA